MKKSPVLFIVFNRPHLTRRVFDAIRASRPEVLYVACDGPRTSRGESEREPVSKVRNIVQQVDWPCNVSYKFSDTNLGCGRSVSEAIGWAFTHEERLIILEDDCLPHKDFFTYCDQLLERYKDDARVGAVNGTSFLPSLNTKEMGSYEYSYYFSHIHCVWGWATWRRVWQQYSFDMPCWDKIKRSRLLVNHWATTRYYNHVVSHLDMILSGAVDSWDYQLVVTLALENQLIAHPKVNLISNIGAGLDAHHNKFRTRLNNLETQGLLAKIIPPPTAIYNRQFDFLLEKSITQHWVLIKIKLIVFSLLRLVLGSHSF